MIESSFKVYADEGMSTPFFSPEHILHTGNDTHRFIFFFGSKVEGRTLKSEDGGQVSILPHSNDIDRMPDHIYQTGQIVRVGQYAYTCKKGGKTAAGTVVYSTEIGDTINDGAAVFLCVGLAHNANDIKLSKTLEGLEQASYGTPLNIGEQLQSLEVVSVHVEVKNNSNGVYNSQGTPMISVHLNPCLEFAE